MHNICYHSMVVAGEGGQTERHITFIILNTRNQGHGNDQAKIEFKEMNL